MTRESPSIMPIHRLPKVSRESPPAVPRESPHVVPRVSSPMVASEGPPMVPWGSHRTVPRERSHAEPRESLPMSQRKNQHMAPRESAPIWYQKKICWLSSEWGSLPPEKIKLSYFIQSRLITHHGLPSILQRSKGP